MGVRQVLQALMVVAPAIVAALPAPIVADIPVARRQEPAPPQQGPPPPPPAAPAGGLTDIDILQFALTLEHLEATFYAQGFAKFPASDFQALGLSQQNIASLQGIGQTEATHVSFLLSAISGAGTAPVQPCQYNFGFTNAAGMVATARVLEAVGVSAYLAAAPLVSSPAILSAAGSIVTVEARHQAAIRLLSQAEPVPAAFDVALGPRAVFTLAAGFIQSCPQGSNLNIQPFPAIALQNPQQATAGQSLALQDPNAANGAQFCAFIAPGANQFAPLQGGACTVPNGLQGEVYMMLTRSQSVADDQVVAGPSVIQAS